MDEKALVELERTVQEQIGRVVIGQREATRLLFVALLAEGHVLLEGIPGVGKTLLARCFAASLGLGFRRIQFTPDLMPGDLVGTPLFDFHENRFSLVKGPIFTEFLLADEINRTPPKTQAALLEAMQERQVTLGGETHPLSPGFLVVATENPIEHEGTYPLPEAQLDRFLFKVLVEAPAREEELAVVRLHGQRSAMPKLNGFEMTPLIDLDQILAARDLVAGIRIEEPVVAYIVDLVRATRESTAVQNGASPRAGAMLAAAARAWAALEGRRFVIPDDVQAVFVPGLRHRLILTPSAEVDGVTSDELLFKLLDEVPAPR